MCLCGHTSAPKAFIALDIQNSEIDTVREFLYRLTIKWNMGYRDQSYHFSQGPAAIQAAMQRPDGLEAKLLSVVKGNATAKSKISVAIYCEAPCTEWHPFAEALLQELSRQWSAQLEVK
jgi:hypothetical protein